MMASIRVFLFQLCPLLLLLLFPCFFKPVSSSFLHRIPRLSPFFKKSLILRKNPDKVLSDQSELPTDFQTFFYTQTLDHFNYDTQSYSTFEQRYVVNSKYWNSGAPILAYLGAEAPLDGDIPNIGFLTDNAASFKALLVYIEHRYYGKSNPFGSLREALTNDNKRGYFNSAQALADYAEVLLHVKKQFYTQNSPIIVVGGSYGGMLASWFRLKYPHIAIGALASSAPILYFDYITPQDGYYSVVTKDFKDVSQTCYETIRNSWSEIDMAASKPDGLVTLSQRFKTCTLLRSVSELKDYLDATYAVAAQYNQPPNFPVTMVCNAIDGAPKETDNLGRIFAGMEAYLGKWECYMTSDQYSNYDETTLGWRWQTCSEMVMPIGRGENETMFPAAPFILEQFMKECISLFGVPPRPHWITTYYGGQDMKLIFKRFASNIIFSNGLKDPYSSGGVLENLSKSVIALTTASGSHCLDILPATETDPEWLVMQRRMEVNIVRGWLEDYYNDRARLEP